MKNIDPVNFEILKIAKELVINEYTDRRAEQHNKWLVESEHLWRTQRLRLAYPTIPPYPTEEDILRRASLLLEFITKKDVQPQVVQETTKVVEEPVKDAVEVPVLEEVVEYPVVVQPATDIQDVEVKEESAKEQPTSKRILPTVLDKLDEMRRSFRSS